MRLLAESVCGVRARLQILLRLLYEAVYGARRKIRDIDLIKSFPDARVSWSVNTLDESFRKDMDNAVSIERRFTAMKTFHDARIRPDRACSTLTDGDFEHLAAVIPERLNFFIEKNAISFEEYESSKGKDYRNTPYLRVYGKAGSPCPACSNTLQRIVIGGRSSVFCPHCQK